MAGPLATKKHYQGQVAEDIAMNWLVDQGFRPKKSTNVLDEEKDIQVGELKYEVKAQVPFMTRNRFGFSRNQKKKLQGANYILLISCPCSATSHWTSGRMWLVDVSKMPSDAWIEYETKSGAQMIGFQVGKSEAVKPDWLEPVYNLTKDEAKFLEDYNSSGWKSNKDFYGTDDKTYRVFE
jgi:hypothetical protein